MGTVGDKDSRTGDQEARQYGMDSMVRIYKSLQAASALPLPAELQDVATTDPELLATPDAPAGVLQLLLQPMQISTDTVADAEQGMRSISLGHAPEERETQAFAADISQADASAKGLQPQTSALLASDSHSEAHDRPVMASSASADQAYCYKDPNGVMQVSKSDCGRC